MKKRFAIVAVMGLIAAGALTFNSQVYARADVSFDIGICPGESSSIFVITNNASGNGVLSCRGTTASGPSKLTVLRNTGICVGPLIHTEVLTWHPNGNYSLICVFI